MKKLKCQMCAGTWIVEENDLEKQRVCPCCASSIQGKVEFETYDSLDKAIYGAITKMGDGVLQNLRQLSGFMMDTAPNLKKEIRIFSKTITDDYVTSIRTLFDQDIDSAETTIRKLRQLFIEEEGLSEAWADMICEALYGAAMYYNGRGITQMINVTVEDVLMQRNDQQASTSKIVHEVKVVKQEENTTTDNQENDEEYSIIEHYKCLICGYVIDGYDLEYGESKNCPICCSSRWEITSDELSDDTLETAPSPSKAATTYDPAALKAIMSNAEKKLVTNNTDAAMEEFRLAANGGYVPAYNSIASIYYSKKNYKKAWKWYLKAADANDSEGQYYVGVFYLNGLHVKKNTHMAIKYFEKSANQKYENASLALAELYINGTGVQKDEKKALKLLTTVAEKGNAKAQYKLGQFYQMGVVVNKDVMQAAHWYQQAMMSGHPDAKQKLDECVSEMPFTQRFKWKLH